MSIQSLPAPVGAPESVLPVAPGRRLASIDALRGFDMFWLMQDQVNLVLVAAALLHLPFQGVLARELDHTPWIGITAWDLIAPLFLFIVGLTLPLALRRRQELGQSRRTILGHILLRTGVLIALGLVFNGILRLDLHDFRYTGVLQRIGLSYLFAAIITLFTRLRGQIAWTALLLFGYWAMMALVPVPGYGRNVMTERGNLEGYLDRRFLPGQFCCYVYGDNEGYLSTIPSIATVMLGVLSAHLAGGRRSERFKVGMLLAGGVGSLAAGWLWGLWFPVITRLWTSSYALVANGWSMLLFALFYWLIDVRGWRRWAFPLTVIGLNPLLIYVVQELFDFSQGASVLFGGVAGHLGGLRVLTLALGTVLLKWSLLYFLYRQRIFLKA